jgi:hypothetical protein
LLRKNMSTVIAKNVQVGTSGTASNNFTLYQPTSPDGTVRLANGNSGTTTDLVTVTSAGNVGVGTSSPSYKLDVTGQARATTGFAVSTDGSAFTPSGLNAIPNYGLGYITSTSISTVAGFGGVSFYTNQAERARIDGSGNLLVGTTTFNPAAGTAGLSMGSTASLSGGGWGIIYGSTSTASSYAAYFKNPNGAIGSIITSGSSTAYNTASDYRLKENVQPMMGALAVVQRLKPVTYTWKVDGSNGQGFIAHELQEVVPDCVTGEKDAIDVDGSISPQAIDTSFLVATLTAAIQEQQAIIEQLKADVAALKAKA